MAQLTASLTFRALLRLGPWFRTAAIATRASIRLGYGDFSLAAFGCFIQRQHEIDINVVTTCTRLARANKSWKHIAKEMATTFTSAHR